MIWIVIFAIIFDLVLLVSGMIRIPKGQFLRYRYLELLLLSTLWLTSNLFIYLFNLTIYARLAYAIGALAIASATLLVFSFYKNNKLPFKTIAITHSLSLSIFTLALLPDIFYFDAPLADNYSMEYKEMFYIYAIYMLALILIKFYLTIKSIKKSQGINKYQAAVIFVGLTFTSLSIFIISGLLPILGHPEYAILDTTAFIFFLVCVYYSIINYRLFDIEVPLKKLITPTISTIAIMASMIILKTIFNYFNNYTVDNTFLTTSIIVLSIIVSIIIRFKDHIEKQSEIVLRKSQIERFQILEELKRNINKHYDKKDMLLYLDDILLNKIRLTNLDIYYYDKISNTYKSMKDNPTGGITTLAPNNVVISEISQDQTVIETAKVVFTNKNNELIKELNKLKAALVLPLETENNLRGIILLGKPEHELGFTKREISILRDTSNLLVLGLENTLLYEKIIADNRMELIGTMAASFAHEIRNPLTSANTYLELLETKKDKPDFIDKFIAVVPREIKRVLQLTTDLLNFAKSSEAQIVNVDLKVLVQRCIDLLKTDLMKKQLKLSINTNGNTQTYADENQLYQVILNIALNAIHASDNNKTIDIIINKNQQTTELIIADEGEGIPAENISKIFEPFYSTKIYGTGLGLATCKRIIEAHAGSLRVESEVGKGSKFIIEIPNRRNDKTKKNATVIEKPTFRQLKGHEPI